MFQLKNKILNIFSKDILDEIEYYEDLVKKKVKGSEEKIKNILKVFGQNDINKFKKILELNLY